MHLLQERGFDQRAESRPITLDSPCGNYLRLGHCLGRSGELIVAPMGHTKFRQQQEAVTAVQVRGKCFPFGFQYVGTLLVAYPIAALDLVYPSRADSFGDLTR